VASCGAASKACATSPVSWARAMAPRRCSAGARLVLGSLAVGRVVSGGASGASGDAQRGGEVVVYADLVEAPGVVVEAVREVAQHGDLACEEVVGFVAERGACAADLRALGVEVGVCFV